MTSPYDDQTRVTAVGDDVWEAELSEGWTVGGGLNGGYLLGVVARALRAAMPGKPDPLAITAYYLSASTPGPARVRVTVRRQGGATATAAAELVQTIDGADHARLSVLATYGDLSTLPDDVRTTATPPPLPPPQECVGHPGASASATSMPMVERFDMRFPPERAGWARGEPSGEGEIRAWFRLEGGHDPDPISLVTAVDVLPPATFDLGLVGWAPTLELSVHVRALPAPGWLRLQHRTRNIAGGMFEEDCEVWDSADRLVAQSRQLARLPRPPRS